MNIKKSGVLLSILFLVALTASAQQRGQLTVEEIVMMALDKSYDVQLSRNTAAASNTDARNAKGLFLPDLTLTGNRNNSKQDSRQTLANDSTVIRPNIRQQSFTAGAQVNWVLFDGLKMFATYNQLQEIAGVNEVLLKNQMANTMASVIGNYYNIVAQKQQLKALEEQISVAEERIKLAERKLEVGSGIKTEWLQAKLDQNAFRTSALQQEATIIQTKANLNTVTGNQLPDQYDVADTIILNLDLTLEEILDGIESTNPTLMAARGNIEVAKFNYKARFGDQLPVISFFSNYQYTRNESNQAPTPFATKGQKATSVTYGLTASWTILNNLIVRDALQIARINLDRQHIIYEQQKAIAFNGARIAYANYDNARKTLAIEEDNIKFARENVFIVLESFKRGIATMIEVRTAQQSIVDAYSRLTAARYNAKVSETELLRLKGALLR